MGLWATGLGAYLWDTDAESRHRTLTILLPTPGTRIGYSPHRLFMEHAPNNWAKPVPINGWDGNEQFPTLHPSINTGFWHGYIESGIILDTAKKPWMQAPSPTVAYGSQGEKMANIEELRMKIRELATDANQAAADEVAAVHAQYAAAHDQRVAQAALVDAEARQVVANQVLQEASAKRAAAMGAMSTVANDVEDATVIEIPTT